MIVYSSHLCKYNIKLNGVIRINVAWIKSYSDLLEILDNTKQDIFLDYPKGRTKPPRPTMHWKTILTLLKSNKYLQIKYFAISNVESVGRISTIRKVIPTNIQLVPKIETVIGVKRVVELCKACKTNLIMLDKEDLYTDTNRNQKLFEGCIQFCKELCKKNNIKILELKGVVFIDE